MAAGMTVAGISGREHGSGSKRSFPRRISARCRCHPPPSVAPPFARQPAAEHGHGAEPPVRLSHAVTRLPADHVELGLQFRGKSWPECHRMVRFFSRNFDIGRDVCIPWCLIGCSADCVIAGSQGLDLIDLLGPRSLETTSLGSLFGDSHFLVGLVLEGTLLPRWPCPSPLTGAWGLAFAELNLVLLAIRRLISS